MLLNRALSGIAPVTDAGSSQSRADVIAIVLSASCVLTGKRVFAINLILLLLQKKKSFFLCFLSHALFPRLPPKERANTKRLDSYLSLHQYRIAVEFDQSSGISQGGAGWIGN